jgi:hypothetical protein
MNRIPFQACRDTAYIANADISLSYIFFDERVSLRAMSFCEGKLSTIYAIYMSSLLAAGHTNRSAKVSASTLHPKIIHHEFIKTLVVFSHVFQ